MLLFCFIVCIGACVLFVAWLAKHYHYAKSYDYDVFNENDGNGSKLIVVLGWPNPPFPAQLQPLCNKIFKETNVSSISITSSMASVEAFKTAADLKERTKVLLVGCASLRARQANELLGDNLDRLVIYDGLWSLISASALSKACLLTTSEDVSKKLAREFPDVECTYVPNCGFCVLGQNRRTGYGTIDVAICDVLLK